MTERPKNNMVSQEQPDTQKIISIKDYKTHHMLIALQRG